MNKERERERERETGREKERWNKEPVFLPRIQRRFRPVMYS